MSFEYNEVEIGDIEDIELISGEISPNTRNTDSSTGNITSEQKRKSQLINLLEDDFNRFHSLLDELIACYQSFGRRNEFLSETLGVPDYVKCQNCSKLTESENGKPICLASAEEKDGETLYKVIQNTDSLPSFCSHEMRTISFPKNQLDEVNDELISIVAAGYEQYVSDQRERHKEKRKEALEEGRKDSSYVTEDLSAFVMTEEEYVARELKKLVSRLFDPPDFDRYRLGALEVAWLLELDDVLQEDYYPQRVEAYLRAMDSPHQSETLPGQGGDEFEQDVREYLKKLNFPMFNRVFKIEGISAGYKEMDIHTELPWGDRAIFEVFTSGSHSEKDKQLRQYGELLKLAEGIDPIQILFKNGHLSNKHIEWGLLSDLIQCDHNIPDDLEPPGNSRESIGEPSGWHDIDYLGDADSLSYSNFDPEFEPIESSQKAERQLIDSLQKLGYEPSLPVYQDRSTYGFCGPTIELGSDNRKVSLTLFANREHDWKDNDGEPSRNERMFGPKQRGSGWKWKMDSPIRWRRRIEEIKDMPAFVVEVSSTGQSSVTPMLFDRLLREDTD